MKSGPLTKPSGSLYDDEYLLWRPQKILERGERRFLLKSNSEVQKKLGCHKAGSCFPHISSSVLWILVKLVPTESSFQGASNTTGYERFGEELAEDVGYYRKLTRRSRLRILVPSFLGTSVLVAFSSTLAALLQFQYVFKSIGGGFEVENRV